MDNTREAILRRCEDELEDLNFHGDCLAVAMIRLGGRLPFPTKKQLAAYTAATIRQG